MTNIKNTDFCNPTWYYMLKVSKEKKNDIKNILNNQKIDWFWLWDNYTNNSNITLYLELDTKIKVESIGKLQSLWWVELKLTKEIQEKNENIEYFALS